MERLLCSKIKKYYICPNGYKLDETSISADSRESCNDKKTVCSRTYSVTCARSEGKYKPTIEVKSGNVGSDGTGNITVYANSKNLPQGVKDLVYLKYANVLKAIEENKPIEDTLVEEKAEDNSQEKTEV